RGRFHRRCLGRVLTHAGIGLNIRPWQMMGALEAVECPIAKPRLGATRAGFLRSVTRRSSLPISSHPSRDSQLMSRLAATITIPVMSTAKQETAEGHLGENAYHRLPFNLPCAWPS